MTGNIIKQWEIESGCSDKVRYSLKYDTKTLTIYSSQVGYLIGKAGCLCLKYVPILKADNQYIKNVMFVEIAPYCDSVEEVFDYYKEDN